MNTTNLTLENNNINTFISDNEHQFKDYLFKSLFIIKEQASYLLDNKLNNFKQIIL